MNKIEKWLELKGENLELLLKDDTKYSVKNLPEAASVIKDAVKNHRPIYGLADYDCDGIMSGCILYKTFTELGAEFTLRFPRKMSEGYGLSSKILPEIPDGALLVTIDNGIAAVDEIESLKERGIDTVVLDHHIVRGDGLVPKAKVLVDPHVVREDGEFEHYCGAGLGYKLTEELGISEETRKMCNVFAAIATIQDIVPIVGDNRNIVRNGLRILNAREVNIPGLYNLMDRLKLVPSTNILSAVQEMDVSFQIGPCINAMGRMYDDGAQRIFERLMHYENYGMDGISEIINTNSERKLKTEEQQTILNAYADKMVAKRGTTCLVVYAPNLHEGIIGINAAKLVESYNMPAIVLTDNEDGKLKGSARSTEDINMKELLDSVSDYIFAYGGHAGAAGLTVEKSKLEDFTAAINRSCKKSSAFARTWKYDIEASEDELPVLYEQMRKYAPYGEEFRAPVFKVNNYTLFPKYGKKYRLVGKNGIGFNGQKVDGVSFSVKEKYMNLGSPSQMNVIANLGWNSYGKGSVQMTISDIQAFAEKSDGFLI